MSSAGVKPAATPTEIPDKPSDGHPALRRNLVLGLLLLGATLVLYHRVAQNNFVNYDDDRYVLTNAHVRAGLQGSTISWAFKSFEQANWHPLTWISHAIDCQLFQVNPVGHHSTNVLLHALNALLLFLIFQRFTGSTGRSLMVAALFAVHPINVESVAWVAERKNVLCMFFSLLAVGAYGWYVRKPGIGRYLAVTALFAMALMSKPMAITLPFVFLLLDDWPLGRMRITSGLAGTAGSSGEVDAAQKKVSFAWLCWEKLPLLALSAGSAVMTMIAQGGAGAVVKTATRPFSVRLENAILCYARYVGKAIWPSNLAVLYPNPHALPLWQVASAVAFLAAITALVVRYRVHRYLLVGWLWFVGTMVPMIGLVQVGNQAMADRYAYLPFVGLFVMVVWGVADVASSRNVPAKYIAAVGSIVTIAFSIVTYGQVSYWHDDLSLWSHTLSVTKNNFVAENNFGASLARQGKVEQAIVHFRRAAELEPGDAGSRLNLGVYAQQHGDAKQAIVQYESALELTNDIPIRTSAYANLGTVYYSQRDFAHAKENLEAAIKLGGAFPVAFVELGIIAQKTGDWDGAVWRYGQLLQMQPSDVALLLVAQALEHQGKTNEAQRAREQASIVSKNIEQAQKIVDRLLQ